MIKTVGLFDVKEVINTPKYSPISLEYFLNMELAMGGGGKEIIKQNGKLIKVKDVVNFFKNNTDEVKKH